MSNRKNSEETSRRSALKKIIGSSALIVGLPLANTIWARPEAGRLGDDPVDSFIPEDYPIHMMPTTTCNFATTQPLKLIPNTTIRPN